MHNIHMAEPTQDFFRCWQAAGIHLQNQVQDAVIHWLRADISPPFLEHLSFRLGNQLFFILLEDVDQKLEMPSNHQALLYIARSCNGHACIMPMRMTEGKWEASLPNGWGLIDAITRQGINPFNLVNNDLVKMTDWELHDVAVQIVRERLEGDGFQVMSSQGNPDVDPSLWFIGTDGPEWVVVRKALYPAKTADAPENLDEIAKNCERIGKAGNFASVTITNHDNSALPPLRGHAMNIGYEGLKLIKRK